MHTRRNTPQWIPTSSNSASYETTFPANSGPVTTKLASGSGSTVHVIEEQNDSIPEIQSTGEDSQQNVRKS